MRLSVRDAYASIFIAAGVLAAVSVVEAWNWPLMNGVRMGVIVLGLAGAFACSVSGWGEDVAEKRVGWTHPFIVLGTIFGVVALVAGLIALFVNATIYLQVMIAAVVGVWLVTLVHRLVAPASRKPIPTA
jgi:hypothetical protein